MVEIHIDAVMIQEEIGGKEVDRGGLSMLPHCGDESVGKAEEVACACLQDLLFLYHPPSLFSDF